MRIKEVKRMKFTDLNLRTQILVSFAAITTISLLIITLVSVGNVGALGDSINSKSTDALENQIINNMISSAGENAAIIQSKFQNAESSVARIVEATENLISQDYLFNVVKSYRDNETGSTLPNATLNSAYGEIISPTTSTYYIPASRGQITSAMNDTINRSAHLDTLLASIWSENPEYVWLYISINDGVFRNFPGAEVDPTGLYNPTQEDWHLEALAAEGSLTYSPPYFDITQGLVVSLTQAVYVGIEQVAVVGLDFKTTTIQEKVLDVNFLDSGYAALMQTSDLTLIAHPEWDTEHHDQNEDIPTFEDIMKNSDSTKVFSQKQISDIVSGEVGVIEYDRNTKSYFLSYAPIMKDNGDNLYTFIISVPAGEVVQAVDEINTEIGSAKATVISSTIVLSILTIAVILFIGLWVSNSITKPVARLTGIAQQLTQNITKKNIFEGIDLTSEELSDDDEVGQLAKSFTDMVGYLREEQTKKKGSK